MTQKTVDFSYLQPPIKEVKKIKHDDYYLKHGEGLQHVRKLFFMQKYDSYEEEKIKEFEQAIQQEGVVLPDGWCRELTMKYVYSGGFNIKKCMERLKKHLEWRLDSTFQTLSPEAEEYLNKGYVYTFGRDPQLRPIIYIQLYQVSKQKLNVDVLLNAATSLCKVITKNMLVPGFIENWIVVIDFNGSGLFDTSFSTMVRINDVLSINFTSTLHRMFIMNPSFLFSASWKIIEKLINPETAAKIQFIKKSNFPDIHKQIDPSQIEQKYGGIHPDLTVYWPIVNTLVQPIETPGRPPKLEQVYSGREEFYSLHNESAEFFEHKYNGQQSLNGNIDYNLDKPQKACCNCVIF